MEQIHERCVAAGGLENWEDQPGPFSTEDRLAAVRRNELKCIWTLITGEGWETYSPENDPEVHRWHQAKRKRQERAGGATLGRTRSWSAIGSWRSAPIRSTRAPRW